MEYNKIVNPQTGRKCLVSSPIGRKVLKNYISRQRGGNTNCQFNEKTTRCSVRKDGQPNDPNCEYSSDSKRCKKVSAPKATPKAAPKAAPMAAPKPSPKVAAKSTPKASHKVAPKTSPRSCDVTECKEITEKNCNTPSLLKKYTTRPSPPYPAVPCAGKKLVGRDGKTMYISKLVGKSYKWAKV